MSSPIGLTDVPGATAARISIDPPPPSSGMRWVCSIMMTASAQAGIGSPVSTYWAWASGPSLEPQRRRLGRSHGVARADGVAVHGAGVVSGRGQGGPYGLGGHSSESFVQGHGLAGKGRPQSGALQSRHEPAPGLVQRDVLQIELLVLSQCRLLPFCRWSEQLHVDRVLPGAARWNRAGRVAPRRP